MEAVSVRQVSKSYGKVKALTNITFDVKPGELFGIIGPDGAGKTTLLRILTTLLNADSGDASVNGLDVVKNYKNIRRQVGYMPGKFSLYQDLTVDENLNFFATLFNTTVKENYHLVEDIYKQIEPFKTRRAGALSGGMKQKLALSCALIHKPEVLFLDEPTTGVDPVSRKEFWEMLKKLQRQGIAILISTSYMDEASLCDRIALINSGNMLKIDTPRNIVRQFKKVLWAVQSKNMHKLLDDIRSSPNVFTCFAFGDSMHVSLHDSNYSIPEFQLFLEEKGHAEIAIKPVEPSIEDCFMDLGFATSKFAES